jgi:3-methylcrotonyl-CoA carboxylase alpha subunit
MNVSYRYYDADGKTVDVTVVPADPDGTYQVTVGGETFILSARLLHRVAFAKIGGERLLQYDGKEYRITEAGRGRPPQRQTGDLRAPMAGKIIQVLVQAGDRVQAGDTLMILEAMKMELPITAPHDGTVDRVLYSEGHQVALGEELVQLHTDEG